MEEKPEPCMSGRTCFFGGKWKVPCPHNAMHGIANPGGPPILLCDDHFKEVAAAGLVKDIDIGQEEFDRREAERLGESDGR